METNLKVRLLAHTPDPEKVTALAARLCYKKSDIADIEKGLTEEEIKKSIDRVIKSGHLSVIEHAVFTFGIEGVSRSLTHQLIRHRIASYSQQSQRYVSGEDFNYIIPPKIKNDDTLKEKFIDLMKNNPYKDFMEISPKEDARFVLPNAAETKIIMTMNARSLYNFFEHRCCIKAQWEIRALANKMLELCREVAPNLFKYAGPFCVFSKVCREKEPCSIYKTVPGARWLHETEGN